MKIHDFDTASSAVLLVGGILVGSNAEPTMMLPFDSQDAHPVVLISESDEENQPLSEKALAKQRRAADLAVLSRGRALPRYDTGTRQDIDI